MLNLGASAGAQRPWWFGRAKTVQQSAAMVKYAEFQFANSRGQQLHGVEYLPDQQSVATLIWHHGICEHIGRYAPVLEHLAELGIEVYSFDVHGHGKSEPTEKDKRALVWRFHDLSDDLYTFLDVVEERRGAKLVPETTFLGGQSMGGLVAAHGILKHPERWAGLIIFSGAIGVVWTPVLRVQAALGNIMGSLIPKAQIVPVVEPKNLHPDPEVVAKFEQDPLVFHGPLRARTGNELLKGIKELERLASKIELPIYMVHGLKDAVTSYSAAERFIGAVSSKDKKFEEVKDGYHEMLMGNERTESANNIIAWIKDHLPPQGSKL